MFKHVLIPTDGSRLARKGVRAGVRLARKLGARVTGLYVIFPYAPMNAGDASVYAVYGLAAREARKEFEKEAHAALTAVAKDARAAGVPCVTLTVVGGRPWEVILRTARSKRCDAIVMASHGRSGIGGLLLGSQTTRVLANSKIPVLVVR